MGMFDKKTVMPSPAKKAGLKKEKQEIEIDGVEELAMIDALQDALKALRGTLEGEVKGKAAQLFMAHIAQTGQKPESFTAVDGGAFASVQMRRKSTAYALSEEAVAVLRESGIEPAKEVVTPELFAINPKYAGDQNLLAKVEKAIAKIVPDDFIIVQPEQSKLIPAEETLNAAIAARSADAVQALTTIACGPKLKSTDMSAILDFVSGLLDAPAFGAAAEEAKKKLRVVK